MIEVINYSSQEFEKPFEDIINKSYDEVRELLPKLPKKIQIYFTNSGIVKELGVGGYAYSNKVISIALDPSFKDKETQKSELRSMIFHESLHIYQNYTGTGISYTPLEGAVYEGMATVFEKVYAGKLQPYGNYSSNSGTQLQDWSNQLGNFNEEEFNSDDNYDKWKFYHPELKERWIVYKVGTWMIDKILENNNLDILDLKDKTAREIIDSYLK